jgi:tetratricopeptide (TPR) repeat protein
MRFARCALAAAAMAAVLASAGCWRMLGREEHERKEGLAKHTSMAEIFWAAGNYEGAAAEYRAVIELAPTLAEAYLGLGNCLSRLDRYGEAAEAYGKASALEPANYDFRFNLGVTLARLKKYEPAAAAFREAAALKPDAAEPYVYLGSALREAGDYEGAAAALARGLVIDPGDALARVNLALTLETLAPARAPAEWRKVLASPAALPEWRDMARARLAALEGGE